MFWPQAGNPRVFGPGRARPIDRAGILLSGALVAAGVLWLARLGEGYALWPGLDALSRADWALYMAVALILGMSADLASVYPPERIIPRVDDYGLTLRSLRPDARARTFVPFDLLSSVTVSQVPRSTDHTAQIDMHPGARWRSCAFSARSATGAGGPEIAAEIVGRASAAGVVVTLCERPDRTPGRAPWSFAPPGETSGPRPGNAAARRPRRPRRKTTKRAPEGAP